MSNRYPAPIGLVGGITSRIKIGLSFSRVITNMILSSREWMQLFSWKLRRILQ